MRGPPVDALAEEADATRPRLQEPGDRPHRRALPRAIGAEETDQLARRDRRETPWSTSTAPYATVTSSSVSEGVSSDPR